MKGVNYHEQRSIYMSFLKCKQYEYTYGQVEVYMIWIHIVVTIRFFCKVYFCKQSVSSL